MIKTAVVILNWNGLDFLKKFLGRVVRNTHGSETVVYVADNGSTDTSCSWIEETFKEVKIIRLERNYGFAEGYNRAFASIDARYFLLLNSDIEVTEGWLEPLVEYMDKNPEVASCQPKILSYNNKSNFEHAGAAGGFIDRYGYPFCRGRVFYHTEKDSGQYDDTRDIFWSTGACMLVRADAWKLCKGLDNRFFAHMEEIDLCWRFHRAGYRVSVVPDSIVYHVGGGSLRYDSPRKTFLNFRNSLFMLYKNLPEAGMHRVLFFRMILDGLAAIMFFLKGQFGHSFGVLKAHIGYYRAKSYLKEKRSEESAMLPGQINNLILNNSIVFEFYIKRNITYGAITKDTHIK